MNRYELTSYEWIREYLPPSGCRQCGMAERPHAQQWSRGGDGAGWHTWQAPTSTQIKIRMHRRRKLFGKRARFR